MPVKAHVVFHSLYTHVYRLAEAVVAGAREAAGAEVLLAQVAETSRAGTPRSSPRSSGPESARPCAIRLDETGVKDYISRRISARGLAPRLFPAFSYVSPCHGFYCAMVILTLLLATLAPGFDSGARARGVVIADALDVLAEPDAGAFATGKLQKGGGVVVVADHGDGWLGIEPPPGSLSWVDSEALGEERGEEARVVAAQATVRAANPAARMPGPPSTTLVQGEIVRLADHGPLTLGQGRSTRSFQAIEPPAGEVRFVRAEGVRVLETLPRLTAPSATAKAADGSARGRAPISRATYRLGPVDSSLLAVGAAPGEGPLPQELARSLAPIEAMQRSILKMPVDKWNLATVLERYKKLLEGETDATARNALRARIAQAQKQESLAASARGLRDLLAQSHHIDQQATAPTDETAPAPKAEKAPYDAVGLLQRSSKQVDGQKVFVLINRKGQAGAYLSIPPGLEVSSMVSRRVGVRGRLRYNESLEAYLIQVSDLDPLTPPP